MNWTLADIAALERQEWPARQYGDAALAEWLNVEIRTAARRNRRLVRRRFDPARVRRRAEQILAAMPPEPREEVALRRAVLAGHEPGERHLVGGVWRWDVPA